MRDLPDGLMPINTAAGVYRYTEPSDEPFEPGSVDFFVLRDGTVEIRAHDAPVVPAAVLRWIADLSEGKANDATGG